MMEDLLRGIEFLSRKFIMKIRICSRKVEQSNRYLIMKILRITKLKNKVFERLKRYKSLKQSQTFLPLNLKNI